MSARPTFGREICAWGHATTAGAKGHLWAHGAHPGEPREASPATLATTTTPPKTPETPKTAELVKREERKTNRQVNWQIGPNSIELSEILGQPQPGLCVGSAAFQFIRIKLILFAVPFDCLVFLSIWREL